MRYLRFSMMICGAGMILGDGTDIGFVLSGRQVTRLEALLIMISLAVWVVLAVFWFDRATEEDS